MLRRGLLTKQVAKGGDVVTELSIVAVHVVLEKVVVKSRQYHFLYQEGEDKSIRMPERYSGHSLLHN